ncbi:ABC transporter ATP-binding protein [Nonomuraea sp. NPDC026600]|uniref:ABC transporter ATP-binding protein n=1 Tax=Nonomuraea sp. NPDC026600 TaxID=3155363 RepID=UPI0034022FF6
MTTSRSDISAPMATPQGELLRLDGVTLRFGGVVALSEASFAVREREICGLIGPNGAGKTTVFNVVSRIYEPAAGNVTFHGRSLMKYPAHRMAKLGIGRTFQNLALFPSMTLTENVMVGAHVHGKVGFGRAVARFGASAENKRVRARAEELLDRVGLGPWRDHLADGLPFGTLKKLEIARALACEPSLLLLDEPAAGLTHGEVDELGAGIRAIRDDFGLSILLVEHHMAMVMSISDRVVAMEFGKVIGDGTPEEIRNNPAVVEAYLGVEP